LPIIFCLAKLIKLILGCFYFSFLLGIVRV
jgi:hypothetical protein